MEKMRGLKVAVIGLGYVGLPLALLAETKGFDVIGFEVYKPKLEKLKKRLPTIDDEIANKQITTTEITFTDDLNKLKDRDVVVVCVPTPVDEKKNPDLGPVQSAVTNAVKHMKRGSLLVIESTINPGVCDEVVIPLVEQVSEHKVGESIFVAHCPERINPGDPKWHVGNINRVLGASDDQGLEIAHKFYSKLIDADIKKMSSLKEAEAVKIVENSFRDVNIAFVNELAMSFNKLGINVTNVIDGAATKPFAFMAHYPGIGVGGHCIPVDPYYLIEYARGKGFDHKFLKLARNINEAMPVYSVDLLEQALIEKAAKPLGDARVAVLGLSYKANVGDDRESPAYTVIRSLEERGAKVSVYDPYMPEKSTSKSVAEVLKAKDAVVLVTGHKEFTELDSEDFKDIKVILDGRSALTKHADDFEKASIRYIELGA